MYRRPLWVTSENWATLHIIVIIIYNVDIPYYQQIQQTDNVASAGAQVTLQKIKYIWWNWELNI